MAGGALDDFLTLQQAADLMRVHRITVWRLVRDGKLRMYQSETNRRVKLVKRADVEALMRPRPIEDAEEKEAA
jgi:excisionase family DNA binding protein